MAAALGEDVAGTAPYALSWVAVTSPRLEVPRRLSDALAGSGVAVVAVRPVTGAAAQPGAPMAMVLCGTLPGATWRRDVVADDEASAIAHLVADPVPRQLLGAGRDPGLGSTSHRHAVLVCADAGTDGCCGRYGPDAALAVQRSVGASAPRGWLGRQGLGRCAGIDVLECSDVGGHRFAPTAVVLPWGVALGGLGPDPVRLAAATADVFAGRPLVDGYRGRSTYPPHVQAAEAAARRHLAMLGTNAGPDDVIVHGADLVGGRVGAAVGSVSGPTSDEEGGEGGDVTTPAFGERYAVRLRHSGGRTIRVMVTRVRTDVTGPRSCGAAPEPLDVWDTHVDADAPTGMWFVPGG